jgi:hypothetical protein
MASALLTGQRKKNIGKIETETETGMGTGNVMFKTRLLVYNKHETSILYLLKKICLLNSFSDFFS